MAPVKSGNAESVSPRVITEWLQEHSSKTMFYGRGAGDGSREKRERNISAVARKKIGAVTHINHSYFIFVYILYSRARNEWCASMGVGEMLKRPFFIDGNRVWRACKIEVARIRRKRTERTTAIHTHSPKCRLEWIIIINKPNANGEWGKNMARAWQFGTPFSEITMILITLYAIYIFNSVHT